MLEQIETSKRILSDFVEQTHRGLEPAVDRKEVVAFAVLSALVHHWPSRGDAEMSRLLMDASRIKEVERSRWMVQRRIAVAKWAAFFNRQPLSQGEPRSSGLQL